MSFFSNRPPGFQGEGDRHLPGVIKKVSRFFKDRRKKLFGKVIPMLNNQQLWALSSAIVELAEDLHCDIGIWDSLERYNREFFARPLPLLPPERQNAEQGISPERLQHFIWVLNAQSNPDFVPAPNHPDLVSLASDVSELLTDAFVTIPADSGIKQFLSQPNDFGWEVKQKAIWLGTHSYLFRDIFRSYQKQAGMADIGIIDDFVCQKTSEWSGLGVIDILAELLDIADARRSELRSWHLRHLAIYRVLSIEAPYMSVLNLINDKSYRICAGDSCNVFKEETIVFGALVPWNEAWYWSGEQSQLDDFSEEDIQEVKQEMLRVNSHVVYRYHPDLLEKAKEMLNTQQRGFLNFFGYPLAVFANAREMQERLRQYYHAFNEMRSRELGVASPATPTIDDSFLDAYEFGPGGKIGLFFNPDEGMETMMDFGKVESGFQKKGNNLTEAEAEVIRQFIFSDDISLNFVAHMVEQYGHASINQAFLLEDLADESAVHYLLRRHKGHFFRQRFPAVSILDV